MRNKAGLHTRLLLWGSDLSYYRFMFLLHLIQPVQLSAEIKIRFIFCVTALSDCLGTRERERTRTIKSQP